MGRWSSDNLTPNISFTVNEDKTDRKSKQQLILHKDYERQEP